MCSVEKDSFGSPIDATENLKRPKKGRNEVRFSPDQPVISSETRETIVSADDVKLTNNTNTKRANMTSSSSSARPATSASQQTTSSSTPYDITRMCASSWTTEDKDRSQRSFIQLQSVACHVTVGSLDE